MKICLFHLHAADAWDMGAENAAPVVKQPLHSVLKTQNYIEVL